MRARRLAFSGVAVFTLLFGIVSSCAAQTEEVLYSFTHTSDDGDNPIAGLASDGHGNLYGTTTFGGDFDGGTIFQLKPPAIPGGAWTRKTIYSFTGGSDGGYPKSQLTFHNHALYGTSDSGGKCIFLGGCGVVFELTRTSGSGWQLSVLHTFAGGADASFPNSGVVFDAVGNMYGTGATGGGSAACGTYNGQVNGCGAVYELTPPSSTGGSWTESVLYGFTDSTDGETPVDELTVDKAGSLYGTTETGGAYGVGVVFQLSPPSTSGAPWTFSLLHAFKGGLYDGNSPTGKLVFDNSGNLFGATVAGGVAANSCFFGCGTIFKLVPPSASGGSWTERLIHKFVFGVDGTWPNGGVVMDSSGTLYGTTAQGGVNSGCSNSTGCGAVYKLIRPSSPGGTWNESLMYSFGELSGGTIPNGGLLLDSSRNVFGTTFYGGVTTSACLTRGDGCGTVFEITQ